MTDYIITMYKYINFVTAFAPFPTMSRIKQASKRTTTFIWNMSNESLTSFIAPLQKMCILRLTDIVISLFPFTVKHQIIYSSNLNTLFTILNYKCLNHFCSFSVLNHRKYSSGIIYLLSYLWNNQAFEIIKCLEDTGT